MRFRTNSKQSPFLNRRHQRRLLMLFGLLVLVIASMRFAADPKTWDWIFANQNPPPAKTEQKSLPVAKSKTKAKPPVNLGPNEIRASASYAKTSKTDSAKTTTGQPSKTPARQAARKLKPGAVDLTVFPREMDDRELGITVNEFSAYLAVLAQAARTSPQELQPLVRKDGTYTVLINNADHFRGEVISIAGRLGSLKKFPKPTVGLGQLYEGWIVTPGSDNNPYRVVFSELPDGLQPQDLFDPPIHVRATGYFFKIQKYEVSNSGGHYRYHFAPLLLARRIDVRDPAESQPTGLGLAPFVVGFAVAIGGLLAFAWWRFSLGDKKFEKEHLHRFEERKQEAATGLNQLQAGESPEEFFANLSTNGPPDAVEPAEPPKHDESADSRHNPA